MLFSHTTYRTVNRNHVRSFFAAKGTFHPSITNDILTLNRLKWLKSIQRNSSFFTALSRKYSLAGNEGNKKERRKSKHSILVFSL
jgi:hypothetical protein